MKIKVTVTTKELKEFIEKIGMAESVSVKSYKLEPFEPCDFEVDIELQSSIENILAKIIESIVSEGKKK